MQFQKHIRSLVLPFAILMGLLLHTYCGMLYPIVPGLVFTMLFLSYTAVDVRKMHFSRLDFWLMLIQVSLAVGLYLLLSLLGVNEIITHGVLVGVITPVAASVVVISCALGAKRETVTTFTIADNLMVAVVAPILYSFIGTHQDLPFFVSFWKIFCRVTPQIVFPFLAAMLLQHLLPKANASIARYSGLSLYVWAFTLTVVLGHTFDDIITSSDPQWHLLLILSAISILLCALQFGLGKIVGSRFGQTMAGGQELGQKNTSFGIWMAVEYLNPFSAVFPAIYSICQNIFNSWQMWRYQNPKPNKCRKM